MREEREKARREGREIEIEREKTKETNKERGAAYLVLACLVHLDQSALAYKLTRRLNQLEVLWVGRGKSE